MSSYLRSKVTACNIRIEPIPTKPVKVSRVVRHENVTVFVDDNGKIYSTGINDGFSYTPGCGNLSPHISTFKCLVKLGVISKADAEEHKRIADKSQERRDQIYAADSIVENAKKLGIKLTVSQLIAVDAAKAKTN